MVGEETIETPTPSAQSATPVVPTRPIPNQPTTPIQPTAPIKPITPQKPVTPKPAPIKPLVQPNPPHDPSKPKLPIIPFGKPKKSIFKKWWFWTIIGAIIIMTIIGIFFLMTNNQPDPKDPSDQTPPGNNPGGTSPSIREICQETFTEMENRLKASCSNTTVEETYKYMKERMFPFLETGNEEECLADGKDPIEIFKEECNISEEKLQSIIGESIRQTVSPACLNATAALSIDESTIQTDDPTRIVFTVTRGDTEFNLTAIEFTLSSGGEFEIYLEEATTEEGGVPEIGEQKTYAILYSNLEISEPIEEIAVAAVITEGNTEKVCEMSSSIIIP